MSLLKWLVVCTFPAGLLFSVLAFVFRVDAHAMAFPQPWLLAIALVLILISLVAGVIWLGIELFT